MTNKLLILLFFPLLCFGQKQNRSKLDSLLNELSSGRYAQAQDTNKVKLLCAIARKYKFHNKDSGAMYANQALALAEKLNYLYGRAISLSARAVTSVGFDEQLNYHHNALKIFEQVNDDQKISGEMGSIGRIYFNMENFPKAIEYFEKERKYCGKIHDTASATLALGNIAAAYGASGNHAKSLEYSLLSLRYHERNNNYYLTATTLSNIAADYLNFKNYNTALVYARRALRIFKSIDNDMQNYSAALSNCGDIYFEIFKDSTTKIQPDSLLPAGKAANLAKAIYYYREAHTVYQGLPNFVNGDVTLKLSQALEAAGNYREALKFRKESQQFNDSMLSRDTRLQISVLETKREADLKERQIELNKIQAANEQKERAFFIIGIAFLGIVIALVWRNNRRQKAANTRLSEEKQRSDNMAATLQESLLQKETLATQLAHAADMKTRFLANISHELRTPVTLLTGMLGLMKDKSAIQTAKNEEQLEVAYNNSRRLQYMVEEILDLSRLETGNSRLNMQTKEIVPLLKRMVYAFETFIEKQQIALSFIAAGAEGTYVQVDEYMLEKVINNLIYNAIKFNIPGGWLKVMATTEQGQFILSVSNSGSGIRQEDLPHVFERYYQGNTATTKAEGVGIGLSLVKEFTSLMSGIVHVTSTPSDGTTFTLQFPIAERPAIEQQEMPVETTQPIEKWEHFPSKQTVLIVEDNEEMRYYLREVLGEKVNLAEAANGVKALEWLNVNKADLIISDLMMPQMGGQEFITNLKNHPQYKSIPVITLTALADAGTKLNMLRLGIDDYIVKPFDASELRIRVYNLLSNLQERRQFDSVPAEPDDIPVESKEAETFKEQITTFVLGRMKTFDVSVYDLAYEMNMSERQLYRLAKRLTGCTPAQLIKEVRLQKAYELLLSGTVYKVEYVSKQVGFEDSSYFSKQFYERFGKRPTDFL